MRILMLVLALLLAAPSLGQTPETITFEGISGRTPVAYKPDDPAPKSARLKTIELQGGGVVRFRSLGGCKCVALVTHMGTTSIVAVSRKGKIQALRQVDVWVRKAPGARIDSLVLINAGTRRGDDPSTTAVETNFALGYDGPGRVAYRVFEFDGAALPLSSEFSIPAVTATPLDLTGTPLLNFERVQSRSGVVTGDDHVTYDNITVSYGH